MYLETLFTDKRFSLRRNLSMSSLTWSTAVVTLCSKSLCLSNNRVWRLISVTILSTPAGISEVSFWMIPGIRDVGTAVSSCSSGAFGRDLVGDADCLTFLAGVG
ncbi:hypothetical protein DPMN_130494 [Dreissena polymorpha]|uniref:Uncharacterized protein n=1 Tax=Dreissena polymorpha TaxID=45954 RepID=A0A9D4JZ77_DREPO|nr:hypothetical protein DPMN_130494 [Dreissena polymorpha]